MLKRSRLFLLFVAMSMIVPGTILAADDYKKEYKMSVVVGPKLPWGAGATKFADLVRERTDPISDGIRSGSGQS